MNLCITYLSFLRIESSSCEYKSRLWKNNIVLMQWNLSRDLLAARPFCIGRVSCGSSHFTIHIGIDRRVFWTWEATFHFGMCVCASALHKREHPGDVKLFFLLTYIAVVPSKWCNTANLSTLTLKSNSIPCSRARVCVCVVCACSDFKRFSPSKSNTARPHKTPTSQIHWPDTKNIANHCDYTIQNIHTRHLELRLRSISSKVMKKPTNLR